MRVTVLNFSVGFFFFFKISESRLVISEALQPHGLYLLWNSPGQNTGVGSLSLLQGIFPTQGLKINNSLLESFMWRF